LASLLATAGVSTRYVTGVIQIDPQLFTAAVGDMANADAADRAAQVAGWPHAMVRDQGGRLVGMQVAHVWVEMRAAPARPWVPVDVALKPSRFTAPVDLLAAAGLTQAQARALLQNTTTFDPATQRATGLNTAGVDQLEARLASAARKILPASNASLTTWRAARPPAGTPAGRTSSPTRAMACSASRSRTGTTGRSSARSWMP
jgi:hypothetical protein